jgi:cullin-associated NEDD8-dissociated protein 1
MLWIPLFENSENSEDTTRNVAAACLGKLAITHPSKYLPQLHASVLPFSSVTVLMLAYDQARINDPVAATRATVVSAIRYTFADTTQSYDELLGPIIVDFLGLMQDEDLVHVVVLFFSCIRLKFFLRLSDD